MHSIYAEFFTDEIIVNDHVCTVIPEAGVKFKSAGEFEAISIWIFAVLQMLRYSGECSLHLRGFHPSTPSEDD